MTVLEKIKRCVSLVWDFQEIYGEEDIEDFCRNELYTYPQHNEIVEYFKHIENLEKENTELEKSCDETQELLDKQIEATYKLDKENAELKARLNAINLLTPELEKQSKAKKKQLTKARELIKTLLLIADNKVSQMEFQLCVADAKQFLSCKEILNN